MANSFFNDLNISKRFLWVDWLKFIGIIGVLGIHVSAPFFHPKFIYSSLWYQGLFVESLFRFGIILFVMASGYLLLRKKSDYTDIPRRIKRVIMPFLFWLFIYCLIKFSMGKIPFDQSIFGFLSFFVSALINPTIASIQFWFVYMIIGLYLFLPIISKWIHNANIKEIEYFLYIWLFVLLIKFFKIPFLLVDYILYFGGFIGFFVLGYYLSIKKSQILKNPKFGLILYIIGTLMTFLGTIGTSFLIGQQSFLFVSLGDLTPNAILQAVGLFIIIFNTDFKNLFGKYSNFVNNIVVKVSLASYGVYLSNMLIVKVFDKIVLRGTGGIMIINLLLSIVVILAINTFLIYVMNKIPFFKKFSGI